LKSVSAQPAGRSNNWAGSAGGPVRVPWLYNGKDKLFFFFAYNAAKDVKTEEANQVTALCRAMRIARVISPTC
jgi:hypothetical protein